MARANTPTLLALDRYFSIMGINPAHANGAANGTVMPYTDCCTDIWFQWDYQFSSRVGREALAEAIAGAERDLAEVLGYWPAPVWVSEEVQNYPRHHRPDVDNASMRDVRGHYIGVRTRWGQVIAPGVRAVSLVGTVTTAGGTLAYSDADGDGVIDTATVSIATSLTDARNVKVYFQGQAGDPIWEIRPARSKAIAAGTFTATFWAWQFIDPDLWEALPTTAEPVAIDWNLSSVPGTYDNLVINADVYEEYTDTTAVSAELYWDQGITRTFFCTVCGGSGCTACTLTKQDGCLHVRDAVAGIVVPQIASYDAAEEAWTPGCPAECRDPDFVKLWYYTGMIDERYLNSQSTDPLSQYWAQTIAWLATARLERPFCNCDRVQDMVKHFQADMALVGGPTSYNATLEQLNCPWGTRRGAIIAWQRVSKLVPKRARVAVI